MGLLVEGRLKPEASDSLSHLSKYQREKVKGLRGWGWARSSKMDLKIRLQDGRGRNLTLQGSKGWDTIFIKCGTPSSQSSN